MEPAIASKSIANPVDTPEEPALTKPARRAIGLMAGALAVVIVASLLYLRPGLPATTASPSPTAAAAPRLSGPYSATFDFLDPARGWALVLDYSVASRFWIFATTDGAAHWRRLFAAPAIGGNIYLHFFDPDHGLAYAGELYRTVDAGVHWTVVSSPPGGPYFTFASPARGWSLPSEGPLPPLLYATADGGMTWSAVSAALPRSFVIDPAGDSPAFGFRDTGEGWLGAALPDPTAYLTLDGGSRWRAIALPLSTPGYAIYTSSVKVLPGSGVLALVTAEAGFAAAYYSDDRGRTWQQVVAPPQPDLLAGVSFLDAAHWWVSRNGVLFKT